MALGYFMCTVPGDCSAAKGPYLLHRTAPAILAEDLQERSSDREEGRGPPAELLKRTFGKMVRLCLVAGRSLASSAEFTLSVVAPAATPCEGHLSGTLYTH